MLESPARLRAIEFRKVLKGGNSRPLLVVGVDDDGQKTSVVLKLRDPLEESGHWKGTSLACEMICAALARAGSLRVPDYFIVEVSKEFALSVPDREVRQGLERNLGPNFGSEYLRSLPMWTRGARATGDLRSALAKVLSFDASVVNGDRTAAKPNLLWDGDEVVVIDHSLALPMHKWTSEQIAESPLFPEGKVTKHATFSALKGSRHMFPEPHGAWEALPWSEISSIRKWIPDSWERSTGDLEKIFTFLKGRKARFRDIATDLHRIVK